MDCVFCKIIDGEIPSYKIYEDENVFAFLDITQGTKGHTLVIPKKHVKNIFELEAGDAEKIFSVIPHIARALKKTFNPIGLNILNNNDKPLQSVFHFHIHLIPRYEEDGMKCSTLDNYGKFDNDYLTDLTNQIKNNL